MGLASIATAAARIGFKVAGDVKILVTVKSGPTPTHDTATDLSTTTWAETADVEVIAYDIDEKESTGKKLTPNVEGPKSRNKTLLIQHADLVANGHPSKPSEESQIIIDGDEYAIESVVTDPANATHELIIRR